MIIKLFKLLVVGPFNKKHGKFQFIGFLEFVGNYSSKNVFKSINKILPHNERRKRSKILQHRPTIADAKKLIFIGVLLFWCVYFLKVGNVIKRKTMTSLGEFNITKIQYYLL